jgi:hypothetical protein
MNVPAIIYTKIPLGENSSKVLFCLTQNSLLDFDLVTTSPTEFAKQNSFTRHDKFDWHVNKSKPICFFFEKEGCSENNLPVTLNLKDKTYPVQWFLFPLAIKNLTNGTHRNLMQLAVQYVSYGMVDESVIAADYDEDWLRGLIQEQEK